MLRSVLAALLLSLAWPAPSVSADPPPLALGGDPRVDPADFRVTLFASGLDFPLGMQQLADGSLLVGVNRPGPPGGSLLNSTGELLRLVDADDDGVADGAGSVLFTGLDAVTSVRLAGTLAFVATGAIGTPRIHVLRQGATPSLPFSALGSLDFTLPLPWDHLTFTLAVRAAPGAPDAWELFFNLGSRADAVASTDTVSMTGLLGGVLEPDSLYRVRVDDTGAAVVVSNLERVASGVRNGFGIAFQPGTGDLYFEDNGIDGPGPDPVSTDELDRIAAAEIGGSVEDFGFPSSYVAYRSGAVVGGGGTEPVLTFQPLPPADGAESEGPAEIAFAPAFFPPGLNDGLFVGFHGVFDQSGLANEENPVVYVDLGTGHYFHFVSNAEPGLGHPDGLLSTEDALFIADLTNASGLGTYGTGAIYQIRALPGPCRNGSDDDGDGFTDFPADPGCRNALWPREDPECQDGLHNDGDGKMDFDGGASIHGAPLTDPDPQCGAAWRDRERRGCGLGFELAGLALLGLARAARGSR